MLDLVLAAGLSVWSWGMAASLSLMYKDTSKIFRAKNTDLKSKAEWQIER